MSKYDKSVIIPVISVLALGVGAIFHITIDDASINTIAEFVAAGVTLYFTLKGILQNHKKYDNLE